MHPFPHCASLCRQALAFSLLTQLAAAVPYTYVDATPDNTTLDGTALTLTPTANYSTANISTDGLWSYRSSTAGYESGNYFESDSAATTGTDRETTADLITTITLAEIGIYDIVVIFDRVTNATTGRDIAAKIGSTPTVDNMFTTTNALNVNQNGTPDIIFDSTYTSGRANSAGGAYLGQVTTTSINQTVSIYINGLNSRSGDTASIDQRTQYDGIGYRLDSATPPPGPKHRDVFLFAGQSNCDGRALKAELTGDLAAYAGQQPGVLIHYTNTAYANADKSRYKKWVTLEPGYSVPPGDSGALPTSTFGEEIGAAKLLATQYANPAIIKVTRGGTALGVPGTDWYPGPLDSPDTGPLYKALIESTQLALAGLEAVGETYTVHALYWHQGESDTSRTAEYGGLLTTLIESVRRDLNMPNLRAVVGELASTKPQSFRDVQWNVAHSVANANFISSRGLVTFEGTHFTTASMVIFGERIGYSLLPNRDTLDFEAPAYALGALDRQDECAATLGLAAPLQVVATAAQGEYPGGQAAGHVGATGGDFFSRRNALPLSGARSMQADFFPGDSGYDNEADTDSSLRVAAWGADTNEDGFFGESETAIGFGLDDGGTFCIQIGNATYPATSFTYQNDRWYHLSLDWSEPDAGGNRTVNLFARDLADGTDLNGGAAILSLVTTSAEFDGNPAQWSGIGCRTTRGLVDHIGITPPGFAAWTATLYPSLAGGLLDDADQDGISNAVEFAFGLDPLHSDPSSSLPQPVYGPGSATVSFTPLATQPGILHSVEWSRNLTSWTSLPGTRSGSLLEFTVPTAGEPAIFIRHRVDVTE